MTVKGSCPCQLKQEVGMNYPECGDGLGLLKKRVLPVSVSVWDFAADNLEGFGKRASVGAVPGLVMVSAKEKEKIWTGK